jgi:hypothetical protein
MFVRRTNTGRIVYDRKKHPFKWADAHRIVRGLEIPEPWDENYLKEYWQLVQTARTTLEALSLAGLAQFEEVLDLTAAGLAAAAGDTTGILRGLLASIFDFSKVLISWWERSG